jgi:hypothetical protein
MIFSPDILVKLGMKRKKKWAVEGQIKRKEDIKVVFTANPPFRYLHIVD